MTDLSQALTDIRAIRRQVASTTEFRGYGPAALTSTALIAVLVGAIQSSVVREPASHPLQYVSLWLGTAILCAAIIATQMLARATRLHSGMAEEVVQHAVLQFLPVGFIGLVLPLLLLKVSPATIWLLPGLWQLLSGLGVFACLQCMPRTMVGVGAWFFATGVISIALGSGFALSPLSMSLAYAIGMSLTALIQYKSGQIGCVDEIL